MSRTCEEAASAGGDGDGGASDPSLARTVPTMGAESAANGPGDGGANVVPVGTAGSAGVDPASQQEAAASTVSVLGPGPGQQH